MSSIPDSEHNAQRAPALAGRRNTSGVRGRVVRRPLTAFLILVLVFGWLILAIPVLASRDLIPGAGLPLEVFALAETLLVMLPAALGHCDN